MRLASRPPLLSEAVSSGPPATTAGPRHDRPSRGVDRRGSPPRLECCSGWCACRRLGLYIYPSLASTCHRKPRARSICLPIPHRSEQCHTPSAFARTVAGMAREPRTSAAMVPIARPNSAHSLHSRGPVCSLVWGQFSLHSHPRHFLLLQTFAHSGWGCTSTWTHGRCICGHLGGHTHADKSCGACIC